MPEMKRIYGQVAAAFLLWIEGPSSDGWWSGGYTNRTAGKVSQTHHHVLIDTRPERSEAKAREALEAVVSNSAYKDQISELT